MERPKKRGPLRPVGEIARGNGEPDRVTEQRGLNRVDDTCRRRVVVVQHVGLVVPPEAEIDDETPGGVPVVLDIRTDLRIVRAQVRVTKTVLRLERVFVRSRVVPVDSVRAVVENRVCGEELLDVIPQDVEVRTDLEHVLTVPMEAGVCQVVPERQPVLLEFLFGVLAADPSLPEVISADQQGVNGYGIPVILLPVHGGLVEPSAAPGRLVLQRNRIHVVLHILSRLVAGRTSEAPDVRFMSHACTELERLAGLQLVRQFAEEQRFTERLEESSVERPKVHCVCREGIECDGGVAVLIVPLIGGEHVQPVLDEGPTDASAEQAARKVGLRRTRAQKRITSYEVLPHAVKEGVAVPGVGTRLGGGSDHCARRLLVLGLVVLGDNPELLHRVERERIPATRVLAGDASQEDVVLVARSINEHVDRLGCLCTGGKSAPCCVEAGVLDLNTGRKGGKVQEVAVDRGQVLNLSPRHIRSNL